MAHQIAVHNLEVSATSPILHNINLAVQAGEKLGIVGESGSGKSMLLRSIIDLLPRGITRTGGHITRLARISMVFQDPLTALDPMMRVGHQVAEVVRTHSPANRHQTRLEVLNLFQQVHLPEVERIYSAYPHQLSGGQRQRVVLAIALATQAQVLLCDEPTTALDVTLQQAMLELLDDLNRTRGLTLIFVSHDLAVVTSLCDRLAIMKSGAIVETGSTSEILQRPRDPYTQHLLNSVLPLPPTPTYPHISRQAP